MASSNEQQALREAVADVLRLHRQEQEDPLSLMSRLRAAHEAPNAYGDRDVTGLVERAKQLVDQADCYGVQLDTDGVEAIARELAALPAAPAMPASIVERAQAWVRWSDGGCHGEGPEHREEIVRDLAKLPVDGEADALRKQLDEAKAVNFSLRDEAARNHFLQSKAKAAANARAVEELKALRREGQRFFESDEVGKTRFGCDDEDRAYNAAVDNHKVWLAARITTRIAALKAEPQPEQADLEQARRDYRFRLPPQDEDRCCDCKHAQHYDSGAAECSRLNIHVACMGTSRCPAHEPLHPKQPEQAEDDEHVDYRSDPWDQGEEMAAKARSAEDDEPRIIDLAGALKRSVQEQPKAEDDGRGEDTNPVAAAIHELRDQVRTSIMELGDAIGSYMREAKQ